MPNLSQALANAVGIKLPKETSKIPSNYIPAPEKYIVIYNGGDEQAKVYDHYNIVLDLCITKLKEEGIEVIQIGDEQDTLLRHVIDYRQRVTFRQKCFLLERAKAYLGNDSDCNYIAGAAKTPIVSPISADHAQVTKPHYIGDHVYLESHRNGNKPSYGLVETNKTINLIKPEEIAQALFDLLKIDYKVSIETVKVGIDFYSSQLDFLCDYPIEADAFKDRKIVARMDLNYNHQALAQCLYFYKCAIVTAKPLPQYILEKFRDKIEFIVILLEKGYSKGFIDQVARSGINYTIISEFKGKVLADAKLDLIDFNPIRTKKTVDISGISRTLLFRTNRVFLSDKKMYASAYHWRVAKTYNGSEELVGDGLNSVDFQDSLESYHFFRIKK